MTDQELEDRAIRRHRQTCRKNNFIYQQPSMVEIYARRVVLSNRNGVLAVFKRTKGDRLFAKVQET